MITPSLQQEEIANLAIDWYYNSSESTFQISGGPGTGKSFLLHYIVSKLGLEPNEVAPMTYTGAAAIVMRHKGFQNAKTMHSWLLMVIKTPKVDSMGNQIIDPYFNIPEMEIVFVPKNLPSSVKLVVVDEGKMVPEPMRKLLSEQGRKVIVAGDVNQLDPVGYPPAYITRGKVHYLTEIFRQKQNSGIVWLSERIKNNYPIHCGKYSDCLVIYDTDFNDNMITGSDIILCGKNETREMLTGHIREDLLRYDSWLPSHGERVVCRNNRWDREVDGLNLANGLIGTVYNYPNVLSVDSDRFEIDFNPLNTPSVFDRVLVNKRYFIAPFKDKMQLKSMKHKGDLFEYAYAITTHIAQGSEYSKGIYFEEYLNKNINTQLNYTGITRFKDFCIYVKKRRRLY